MQNVWKSTKCACNFLKYILYTCTSQECESVKNMMDETIRSKFVGDVRRDTSILLANAELREKMSKHVDILGSDCGK